MVYDSCLNSVISKANSIMVGQSPAICRVVKNSISSAYIQPEFDVGINFVENLSENSKIVILASWLSLMTLEILERSKKVKDIILLDHDKTVIELGKKISTLYPSMSILYLRKNVVFNNIDECIDGRDGIIIPSVNMLLPFDELIPSPKKGTLVSLTGTSNMLMRYGNPIYNVDDLKSQITAKIIFSKYYNTTFQYGGGDYKFKTSVLVGRI